MGLLSWFFPSAEDRVARARAQLAKGRPDEARLELLDLDHPDAKVVLAEAENALALRNLAEAVNAVRSHDDVRAADILELAERFHHGGHEAAFQEARKEMRDLRADRGRAAERAQEEAQRRLLAADPLGVSGGPSWLDRTADASAFGPEREELEARLALAVENYPESLKPSVAELGASFGQAVLDLEDGRPDLAIQALVALPDDQPLVQWERARAAYVVGDPAAAAKALRRFVADAGHHAIGQRHSATFLAQCLAESGDLPQALKVLRSARTDNPKLGGLLYANLLEASGELENAETVLKRVIQEAPRVNAAYVALARVRVRGDHRPQAIQANGSCKSGQCGYQPPDLEVHRMLATLYLEDGVERDRALELAGIAQGLIQKPTWPDLYLAALTAHAQGSPETRELVDRLIEVTPPGTAAAAQVAKLTNVAQLTG
jgi:tetratricopeptide (TPR) repeat protein